jgi:hypothetical protein
MSFDWLARAGSAGRADAVDPTAATPTAVVAARAVMVRRVLMMVSLGV